MSELEGRGAAWTEERGTSDERRRRSEGGWGGAWCPGGERDTAAAPPLRYLVSVISGPRSNGFG